MPEASLLLTRPGARVAYTDTGAPADRPDAPVVVLGHGLLFSGRMFDAQVAALRPAYRCLTVDWRSQGRSPRAAGPHDMDTLLGDLVALLDECDTGPVHYVGLSMGGFVGMRLAARHPDRVRTLTLLDTSAAPEPAPSRRRERIMAHALPYVGLRPLEGQVAALMFGPTFLRARTRTGSPEQQAYDAWRTPLVQTDRRGLKQAVLGVLDRDGVEDELGRITALTLVVTGADDRPTPVAQAERIVAGIPGARLEVVPACGHSCTVEQPDVVTRLLVDHLDRG